jgi:geranylgeranyl pyrophosphate synthase
MAAEFQIEPFLRGVSQRVDRALAAVAESRRGLAPARLVDGMVYALLGGGKRLRPALILAACEAHGGDASDG